MSDFYVYLHCKATNGEPYYVGKGKGRRAWKMSGRSERWQRTHSKYGTIVEVIFENLSEEEAFDLEKNSIIELKYCGYSLANLTDGGEGASGRAVTDRQRELLRLVHLGKPKKPEAIEKTRQAHLNKEVSAETRVKMAEVQRGKTHSEATKALMSKYHYEQPTNLDENIYTFYHKNGAVFTGTRVELCRTYSLLPKQIRNLFATKATVTAKGWRLTPYT